jgi:hypothetical protein
MTSGLEQDQSSKQVWVPLTEPPGPEFVYNPWEMKEVRRLNINVVDRVAARLATGALVEALV